MGPMKYDAVLFDLFGTLIDVFPQSVYNDVTRQITTILAVPHDEYHKQWMKCSTERNRGDFGSTEDDIRHVCGILGACPDPEQIAKATELRLNLQRRNQTPRAGAIDTLRKLREMGMKIALVSDSYSDVTRVWMESEFAPLMDAAVFSCDLGVTKPNPALYKTAYERLGVRPDRCMYVGDGGGHELTGAKALGIHPVLMRVDYDHEHDAGRPDLAGWQGPRVTSVPGVLDLIREYGE